MAEVIACTVGAVVQAGIDNCLAERLEAAHIPIGHADADGRHVLE
ncbi:MAG: hypothetical protein ACT4NU_01685 [Chromatiales bacterium]